MKASWLNTKILHLERLIVFFFIFLNPVRTCLINVTVTQTRYRILDASSNGATGSFTLKKNHLLAITALNLDENH